MFDSRDGLLDVYRATPLILRLMLGDIDDDLSRKRPGEGDWSIVEIIAHLADIEGLTRERVERLLAEDNPLLPGIDQEQLAREHRYHEMRLADTLRRFEEHREALVRMLEGLDESGWRRAGRHSEFNDLTIESLTTIMAAHDAVHLAQVARILTGHGQPG